MPPAPRSGPLATAARVLLALGVALALADASVVTLALPEVLTHLDTTVQGVAAVIGVYTVVLAVAVLVAVPLRRLAGSAATGAVGMAVFALASVVCGEADTLSTLLVARGAQAVGAGLGLVAAFALLHRGGRRSRLWIAAAVFGTAIGPALGGALTELFDWRAIFLAQAPFGVAAALAALVPLGGDPARDGEPVADAGAPGDGTERGRADGTNPGRAAGPGPAAAWPGIPAGGAGASAAGPGSAGSGAGPGGAASASGTPGGGPTRQAWGAASPPRGPRSRSRPAGADDDTRVWDPDDEETVVPGLPPRPRPPAAGTAPTLRAPDADRPAAGAGPGAAGRPGVTGPAAGAALPRSPLAVANAARAGVALALVSAALTAVVFLLVLLLVSGWSLDPLAAAAAVTILPVAALAGARIPGDAWVRACAGSALVGAGVLALAALPNAEIGWIVLPQVLAGLGMGLALPALAGELLPERSPAQAAGLLALRHVGITAALLLLAPGIATELDRTVERTELRVAALVLDARLPPREKVESVSSALGSLTPEDARGALEAALDKEAPRFAGDAGNARTYAELTRRADETLVGAIDGAFRTAFVVTGCLALLAALLAFPLSRGAAIAVVVAGLGLALAGGQVLQARSARPPEVVLADPCQKRDLPDTGGLSGFVQDTALRLLDRAACRYGSSREELALAIADDRRAKAYERRYGTNPRQVPGLLGGAVVGGEDKGPGKVEQFLDDLLG